MSIELIDDVYGTTQISSELIKDLILSAAVQRLKGISQAGAPSLMRPGRTVTRYEHSIGVMILTGRLGGIEIEQAAGLLQDVSHTAFSHTIDYVFGDRNEGFHEQIFASVIDNSDLPYILGKHNLTWQEVFRPENLIRVDAPAPLLCADRIDYTLRDLLRLNHISSGQIRYFLDALAFVDNTVVLTNIDQASAFVSWYRYLVGQVYMNPLDLFIHDELARILKASIDEGVLAERDFQETDSVVLAKIKESDHQRAALRNLREVKTVHIGPGPGARKVYSKGRIIDPPVLIDGRIVSFSEIMPDTAHIWDEILACASEGILVRRALWREKPRVACLRIYRNVWRGCTTASEI
jgi:HD superfamily phosphohydrolase